MAGVSLFFLRHRALILSLSLVSGLTVARVLGFLVPREHEATVVAVPLQFATELKPQGFTIQAYQQILESDSVVAQTAKDAIGPLRAR